MLLLGLRLNDDMRVRLRQEYRYRAGSFDSVHHRLDDGKALRKLNIPDEPRRECPVTQVKRKLNSAEVIDVLTDMFILRGLRFLQVGQRS